jgi:hypothetical protein
MADQSEEIIEALKRRFAAATDQVLAERLSIGRSTVASWRSRGSVPRRYAALVDEENLPFSLGIGYWSGDERAATILALMRMHAGYLGQVDSYSAFLGRGGFIFSKFTVQLERAYIDLQGAMERHALEEPMQALNLLVFEELFEGARMPTERTATGN